MTERREADIKRGVTGKSQAKKAYRAMKAVFRLLRHCQAYALMPLLLAPFMLLPPCPVTAQEFFGADGKTSRSSGPLTGSAGRAAFSAFLAQGGRQISSGLVWRVFAGRAGSDGSYKLLKTLSEAQPVLDLPPGDYLVNAAYGRASITKKIAIQPGQPLAEEFVLNAGGLRLYATLSKGQLVAEPLLNFEVYSEETDQFGNRRRIMTNVKPGIVLRLNSGIYRVISTYGDGNATVDSDVVVEPGKLTEATVDHDAGKVTFKLVHRPGGEALADTRWVIATPAGDVVKETAGAFPTHILAAGSYRVTAQHGEREFVQRFTVQDGENKQVEVVIP